MCHFIISAPLYNCFAPLCNFQAAPLCNYIFLHFAIRKVALHKLLCFILQCFFLSVKIFCKVNQLCRIQWSYFLLFISFLFIRTTKWIHYFQSVVNIISKEDPLCRVEWSYFQLFISTLFVRTSILDVYKAFNILIAFSIKRTDFHLKRFV